VAAGEAALTVRREGLLRNLRRLGLCAVGAAVAFAPQMVAWRCVYGSWLTSPLPLAHNWLRPNVWAILGSTDRSLFYWTPVATLACAGFVQGRGRPQIALLALGVAVQVYALALISGPRVCLGTSYGFRFLTESCGALAPGLALLL